MKHLFLVLTAFTLLAPARAAEPLAGLVDRLAQPYVDSETVVGMSIGVVRGDETAFRGYGQMSADDSRTPDGDTLYEIGSVSKVFTGLLLADAVVAGRVSLATPIDDLLPSNFEIPRRVKSLPITLRHLSTHSSGLPRLPDNLDPADPNDPYADYDAKRLATFLKSYKPRKRPGEVGAYSNLGVGLLGYLLAREQKSDYATLLADRVTKPLGLGDTTIALGDGQAARLAPPHIGYDTPGHNWDCGVLVGAGGIRSTASDLVRFARMQIDPPEGPLGDAIKLAWYVHQPPLSEGDFAIGLGWHVARDKSTRWHNGQTGGYHAALFVNRELGVAVVVLANTATMEVDRLAEQLTRALAGAKESPREFEKAFRVTSEVAERYAGTYRFAPGLDMTVEANGDKLSAKLTGQSAVPVYPRTETEWFYKVVDAQLTFEVDKRGRCTAVVLHQNGLDQTAKRID